MTEERERTCLQVMEKLYRGRWRKRAWIFQEILLSKNYILDGGSSGWIKLGDVGVIAGFLFRRRPQDPWLGKFSDWCKRLHLLCEYYGEAQTYELSKANFLQAAADLEATIPADKYYALCGILRLKKFGIQQRTYSRASTAGSCRD